MAYERNNRGRVFTHSRDEFGDFGAFGDIINVPTNLQPWECVMVPKCVLAEGSPFIAANPDVFPRHYWSTHLTGKYATEMVARHLASLGCDPVQHVVEMPAWTKSHTYWRPSSGRPMGYVDEMLEHECWELSDSITARLNPDIVLPAPNLDPNMITPPDPIRDAARTGGWPRFALNGYSHGLTVWPPLAFRDQAHIDAWFAHHQSWRYGWDFGPGSCWHYVPGCIAFQPRSGNTIYEYTKSNSPGALAIKNTYDQTVGRLFPAGTAEVLIPNYAAPGDTSHKGYWRVQPFMQLNPADQDFKTITSTLYTLTCCQMAYHMYHIGASKEAFPITESMKFQESGGDFLDVMNYLVQMATSMASMNVGGMVNAVMTVIKKNLQTASAGSLPWNEAWRPVIVPVSMLADQPLCKPKVVSKTAPVPIPLTEGVRALSSVQQGLRSGTILFSPQFYAERGIPMPKLPGSITEEESSLPLLAALGLGGYLLWKYLRK